MKREITAAIVAVAFFSLIIGASLFSGVEGEEPPVILISIDTFRDDRLAVEGYDRNVTPNLDSFIRDSYYFKNAHANAPWTLPSHSTVFTGEYSSSNGALTWDFGLCEEEETLAERLKEDGYRTVSFNGDGAISSNWGFDQGFEKYSQKHLYLPENIPRIMNYTEGLEDEKLFLFLHGYDTHSPYIVPSNESLIYGKRRPDLIQTKTELNRKLSNSDIDNIDELYWGNINTSSEEEMRHVRNMYDNSVYYMDRSIGKFFEKLREREIYDKALIVLFSDHGEAFMEHGKVKHTELYGHTINAPLAVKFPNQDKGRTVSERVGLIDIYPFILNQLGIGTESSGTNLQRAIEGNGKEKIFSEVLGSKAIIEDDYKLIWDFSGNKSKYELYNLEEDPGETNNLAEERRDKLQDLNESFQDYPDRNYSSYCPPEGSFNSSLFEEENFLR